jgi:hypothetical protein
MKIWQAILVIALIMAIPLFSACEALGLGNNKASQQQEYIRQAEEAKRVAQEEYNRQLEQALEEYLKEYNEWAAQQAQLQIKQAQEQSAQ